VGEQVRISSAALELPGGVTVRFMRTLRLPESGTHALPPGLGTFPLRRVADYPDRAPARWLGHDGVVLPVYQREAMWLSLSSTAPVALQVGVGKVCAVSGRPWSDRLSQRPQNYVVLPRQPWLDGINSGHGTIRQFVAVPLGLGATVEGQVSGEEVWGGVQLQVFELRREVLDRWLDSRARGDRDRPGHGGWGSAPGPAGAGVPFDPESGEYGAGPASGYTPISGPASAPGSVPPAAPPSAPAPAADSAPPPVAGSAARPERASARPAPAMGLGAGGQMRQALYQDERPLGDWRGQPSGRVFVHLAAVPQWQDITGEAAPASPVNRAAYTSAGLPWFDYYDADGEDLSAAETLTDVRPAGDRLGPDDQLWAPPDPHRIRRLGDDPGRGSDGEW
jgi:hypothetical protein